MKTFLEVLVATWQVTEEMAPWLLFGFLMGGILYVLVSAESVERHLGKRSFWQVVKAALLGIPLPLCSCSVVPVSASLYRHGASRGATLSFLASTPQTGVDSIAITWSLLGPVFVLFRVLSAFISGILAGSLVELTAPGREEPSSEEGEPCHCCNGKKQDGRFLRMIRYGFVTLPADIGRAMFFGLLLTGALTALVPSDFFSKNLGEGLPAMLAVMLLGIPLYTCSTASIPVAFGLMSAGLSPGAALVFLVTGPATNAATIVTISQLLGRKATAIYLLSIAATALTLGLILDAVISREMTEVAIAQCHEAEGGILPTFTAIVLLLILLPSFRRWIPWSKRGKS